MKTLSLAVCAMLLANLAPALAAPVFKCSGAGRETFEAVCSDPELVRLDRAVDAALARSLAGADPLAAMLLRRDQRWFTDLLAAQHKSEFQGADDPERKRIWDALQARLKVLHELTLRSVGDLAGRWINAFGTVNVETLADGALRVEITATAADADRNTEGCGAEARLKPAGDGWLAGAATWIETDESDQDKDADKVPDQDADKGGAAATPSESPFQLRLRLQGNTLRVVLMPSEQDSFCDAPEQITGTYFPAAADSADTSPAARNLPAAVAARTVSPSFSCATAKSLDEEEICADPELAARDGDLARAYRDAMRRLDAKTAGFLREDQRAWVKDNATAFEAQLLPGWDKQYSDRHHTGNARNELHLRQNERLAMLANLEPARQGLAGLWVAHNAFLTIAADPEKPGTLHALGKKWESGDYKSYCDFEADGRIGGGVFRTDDSFPTLARDGATLTIDGRDPDRTRGRDGNRRREQPSYCSRMDSAKARLFPVKPHPAIDLSDGRIR